MLSVGPAMLPLLDELEADFAARRQWAVEEDWRGEVEGIDLTLTFMRSKRQQAQRTVAPGLPTLRPPGSNSG